jgi:hypothetical protein
VEQIQEKFRERELKAKKGRQTWECDHPVIIASLSLSGVEGLRCQGCSLTLLLGFGLVLLVHPFSV